MEGFFQLLLNGTALGSIYALIALGYTMVYGILRLINFAHGDIVMVGAYAGLFTALAIHAPDHPEPPEFPHRAGGRHGRLSLAGIPHRKAGLPALAERPPVELVDHGRRRIPFIGKPGAGGVRGHPKGFSRDHAQCDFVPGRPGRRHQPAGHRFFHLAFSHDRA